MVIQDYIGLMSVITNISILAMGIRLVRHLSHIELKVDTMWKVFISKFDIKIKDED